MVSDPALMESGLIGQRHDQLSQVLKETLMIRELRVARCPISLWRHGFPIHQLETEDVCRLHALGKLGYVVRNQLHECIEFELDRKVVNSDGAGQEVGRLTNATTLAGMQVVEPAIAQEYCDDVDDA